MGLWYWWVPQSDSLVIQEAIREIKSTYWDDVSVRKKKKQLVKFWRNDSVWTSEETVWLRWWFETYVTWNDIDTVSSSNAWDSQEIVVEWHTLSGSDLTFVVQTATLDWQNKVTLSTPLYRSTRIYNNWSTNFSGTVYVYEDTAISWGVPSDTSKVHLQTDWSNNQSLKCATSLSSIDYWIVTWLTCSVNRQNTRSVDFKLQIRDFGKVFRTRMPISVHSYQWSYYQPFFPALIVPKNSDARLTAISSWSSTWVEGIIHWYLATIV